MNLGGWIPSRVLWRDDAPIVQWLWMYHHRLLDPFYEQTLQREMKKPFHQLFVRETGTAELMEWSVTKPGLPLRGIIFHMSRCGSTLISQMLAAPLHHVVASEPPPLDGVLRAHLAMPGLDRETHVQWIRAMVSALGQPREGGEDAFYLKLDCWHVHQIELIRAAFPDVPVLFLYREPLEVMVSHASMPAAWTVPGLLHPLALQLTTEEWEPHQLEVYCAKALAKICEGGLQLAAHRGGLLVNYNELPKVLFGRIASHFGLQLADFPAMLEQSYQNAKMPNVAFQPDNEAKRAAATERVRAATEKFLQPLYAELEIARQRQLL